LLVCFRIWNLSYRCACTDAELDEPYRRGAMDGSVASGFGNPFPDVARMVFLDAVCGIASIRDMAALLSI